MDRTAIDDVFRFTDYACNEHEAIGRPPGDDVVTRPAPGSGWPAVRDAPGHLDRA